MSVIGLRRLSLRDAEEAIVELWTCLEEYEIPTPHVDFRFEGPDRVTLCLRIDREWEHVVRRRLASRMDASCLNAIRIEVVTGGRARLDANDRAVARSIRAEGPQSSSVVDDSLPSGERLASLVGMDRSTIRSIH
jgi:hypothetical protein